jgi:sugar O-acyltransferase (sialic acid O-acetyltransferase NeuD family)
MKTKLLIFPFNGNGIEALDCLSDQFECIGFVDDTKEKQGNKNKFGISVFDRSAFDKYREALVLAVPGSPSSFLQRDEIIENLKLSFDRFVKVIHPRASISSLSTIGFNTLIMENVVIKATASVGNHVCVLPNSVVHHDSKVGDFTLIGANVTIAGYTTIGRQCYIGSGSSIINNITIGDRTLIGMAANVIRSAVNEKILVGNPAKPLK